MYVRARLAMGFDWISLYVCSDCDEAGLGMYYIYISATHALPMVCIM